MIDHPEFGGDGWTVVETRLNLDRLAQTESVFALANGHIGFRGNLDEGEPHGLPGTYLGSFYELRPLTAPELIYGDPTTSQTVVNVTNGKIIRLLVDDEPFDIRYGELRQHRRVLDMRAGTLSRTVEWVSPGHKTVRVRSTRLVSLTQRSVAAIWWEVEAVGNDVQLVIQSELVANEELSAGQGDPRGGQAFDHPLVAEAAREEPDGRMFLMHRTRRSGLRVAAMVDHEVVEAPADRELGRSINDDLARAHVITTCPTGARVAFIKYVAYGWSRVRSSSALEDQVAGALFMARHTGFEGLLAAQRQYLDDFWDRADVEVDGDPEVQRAVRFSLWQVLQAGARTEKRAIPAKGLTGPGYDGHAFWDTEMYVLPVLTYTQPQAAADALAWRQYSLPAATERARQLGLKGAAFPWRTIHGEESSGYWPASTAAFHINAGVAQAAIGYLWATGDEEFGRRVGVDLLVATARLWMSLGHHDPATGFRIDGVTGPDEYSAVADNNIYTNLMAQRNLRSAVNIVHRFPERGKELGVDETECEHWRQAADKMVIPYDADLGVHAQSEGFTRHARWDFDAMTEHDYPLLLHFPYFDLYRKQVVKQPDLVFALLVRGDAFTPEEKARDFAYYEALTVRDSSLSACIQAIVAAEVGHLDLAYDYLGEAALLDLDDLEHNTRDGLHIASLAGAWLALVMGFGGCRNFGEPADQGALLNFAPRLPTALTRLAFRLVYLGRRILVEIAPTEATYTLRTGEPVDVQHHGTRVSLRPGQPEIRSIPPLSPGPAPSQPRGRAPAHRARAIAETRAPVDG